MTLKTLLGSAAIGLLATTAHAGTLSTTLDLGGGITGSFDVHERFEEQLGGIGVYNVTNNTNGGIFAFGVSNSFSQATLLNHDGFPTFGEGEECFSEVICFSARTLTASNWNDTVISIEGEEERPDTYSFQQAFGDFEIVAGGDDVFHWYEATSSALDPNASVNNYFGFLSLELRSSIIGLGASQRGGITAFTAGQAVTGTPSPVPVPAAGLLLMAGLGGLGFAARRKKR